MSEAYVARDLKLAQAWNWWSGAKLGDFDNLNLTPGLDAFLGDPHPPQALALSAAVERVQRQPNAGLTSMTFNNPNLISERKTSVTHL